MAIIEFIRRRYAASFNWDRVGFRARWIAAVFYLKRETYEIWLFGKCWESRPSKLRDEFNGDQSTPGDGP
jgi:hypothetical protein